MGLTTPNFNTLNHLRFNSVSNMKARNAVIDSKRQFTWDVLPNNKMSEATYIYIRLLTFLRRPRTSTAVNMRISKTNSMKRYCN